MSRKKAHQKFPSGELLFYICIKQLDMTQDKFIEIVKYIRELIATTKFENKVFAVGGSIRDYYMKQPIKDIDLAVELQNGGIELANFLYENGKLVRKPVTFARYGTCKFVLNAFPEDEIEAVQTRKEKYTDYNSRNPETAFGTLEEDAKRRDLTINAIYLNVSTGETVDLFRGVEDITDNVLRTTSDPDFVFQDDPLRILRVIRFAGKLGWKIENNTLNSMTKNADRLSIISKERITEELKKILTSDYVGRALYYLSKTGVMEELGLRAFTEEKAWDIMEAIIDNKEKDKMFEMNLAILIAVYNFKDDTDEFIERLSLDNDTKNFVNKVIKFSYKFTYSDANLPTFRKICYEAHDSFLIGGALQVALSRVNKFYKNIELLDRIVDFVAMYKNREPEFFEKGPVNGNDIKEKFGVEGKEVGRLLEQANEMWFEHPNMSKEEILEKL